MAGLSAAEKAKYEKDGYVVPSYRLPQARVDALRSVLDTLIRDNPTIRPERLVSAHIEGKNSEGVRGSSAFLDLARDEAILDLVRTGFAEGLTAGLAAEAREFGRLVAGDDGRAGLDRFLARKSLPLPLRRDDLS